MGDMNVKACLIERKGKYYAVAYYYIDGMRKTRTKSTGISVSSHKKREAEKIKNALIQEVQEELGQSERARTLHSFYKTFHNWIEYKSGQIDETTAATYRQRAKTIEKYFKEHDVMIEELRPKDIRNYYDWAINYGKLHVGKDGNRGLKRSTVNDHAVMIKSFLNDAVLQDVIKVNPAKGVALPKEKENRAKDEIAYVNLEQANQFLDFLNEKAGYKFLYGICKLILTYGFRRSEVLGLKWSVFDFEKNNFEINHTVVRVDNEAKGRDNVKKKESHRYYPILNDVKPCLLELMEHQKELGIYKDDGYIFLRDDGEVYNPDYITKKYKKARNACEGIPKDVTLHGLRHSACAILFEQGHNVAHVQSWLGHADATTTMNIYNHVNKKWKNNFGESIDGLFR